LAAESVWKYLLTLEDTTGPKPIRRLDTTKVSLKCRESAVHLMEYLELFFVIHKAPYEDVSKTFLHYGKILNDRLNESRTSPIQMDDRFWGLPLSMHDLKRSGIRVTGEKHSPLTSAFWSLL
jgi:hypothetical protein